MKKKKHAIITILIIAIALGGVYAWQNKSKKAITEIGNQHTAEINRNISKALASQPINKGNYVSAELLMDPPSAYEQEGLYDECLGIMSYQSMPFFENMNEDLALEVDSENYPDKVGYPYYPGTTLSGVITDACYSTTLNKIILLSLDQELTSEIAVIEYDIDKRHASRITLGNVFATPTAFGPRKKDIIELPGDNCNNIIYVSDKKAPSEYTDEELEGICGKSLYVYDLTKKEIREIYEEQYTPNIERIEEEFTKRGWEF